MCQRALALYKKTVERPSQQSVRRAKQLADCHIHPWMLDDAEASERSGSSSSLMQNSKTFGPLNLFSKSMTVCWGLSETLCVCGEHVRACGCVCLCE